MSVFPRLTGKSPTVSTSFKMRNEQLLHLSMWMRNSWQLVGWKRYFGQIVKQMKSPMDNCSTREKS